MNDNARARTAAITATLEHLEYHEAQESSEPGAIGVAPARGQHLVGGAVVTQRTCSVEGCKSPHRSRGWCETHYRRWRAHGDPLLTLIVMDHPDSCTVAGCERPYLTRGWCHMHYVRWRRHGDPGEPGNIKSTGDPITRLLASSTTTADGCIIATRGLNADGYRAIAWTDEAGLAHNSMGHRLMYAHAVGPIPDGLHCHHICHNRACINPEHLRLLTASEHRRLHVAELEGQR